MECVNPGMQRQVPTGRVFGVIVADDNENDGDRFGNVEVDKSCHRKILGRLGNYSVLLR